jgi:hypothetical protein
MKSHVTHLKRKKEANPGTPVTVTALMLKLKLKEKIDEIKMEVRDAVRVGPNSTSY